MASKRLEKIKNARSLNDVMAVIEDIAFEFKNSKAVIDKLTVSLSAGEIVFDARRTGGSTKTRTQEKFVAPNARELQKHVGVIHKLYDNVLELDAAEALVKQAFAGNKKQKAALLAIKELKQEIDNKLNDAFEALEEIANKHVPTTLTKLADGLTSYLIDTLKASSYKDIFRQTYVVPDDDEAGFFRFCVYIGIESLKNTSGFTFDQYYAVITGRIDKTGGATYFLNSFPDFKAPGRYPMGQEISTLDAAKKRMGMLLTHNNLVTDLDKMPMPIDTKRAENIGITTFPQVKKAIVKDDELVVTLDKKYEEGAALQKVIIAIMGRLNAVVGARANKQVFQYRIGQAARATVLHFVLVANLEGKKDQFNVERLNDVADMLGLGDRQREALRFALQS